MKILQITLYACSCCLLISSLSCKKPTVSPPPEITHFPFGLGTQCRYLRTINAQTTDTLTLVAESIYQQFALNGYKCYVFVNGALEDSGYFLINNVSAEYDPLSYHPLFLGLLISLPMFDNQSWGLSGDTTHVSYWGNYQGVDSVYHNVYKQYNEYYSFGSGSTSYIYISPSAGLIYETYKGPYGLSSNSTVTYTLIN